MDPVDQSAVNAALESQLAKVKALHEDDLRRGLSDVFLPFALSRTYLRADGNSCGSTCSIRNLSIDAGFRIPALSDPVGRDHRK